jgi:hypothetical protein
VNAISAALEPADDDGALRQVDVIPAQIASLRDPQAVAVDDQSDQPIPVTVPFALEGRSVTVMEKIGLGARALVIEEARDVERDPTA